MKPTRNLGAMVMTRLKARAQLAAPLPAYAGLIAKLSCSDKYPTIPSALSLKPIMLGPRQKHEVFRSVVELIAVAMMDGFVATKCATERLLHYMPMFVNVTTVYADADISVLHDAAAARPMVICAARLSTSAAFRAELCGALSVGKNKKLFAAALAL